MNNKRFYNMDFLKVLAAIFITNSHFIPVYEDVSPSLATLGVHGNALFFFVSGFLLTMGFEKRQESLDNWYKKRIQRLSPPVMLWGIISTIIWQSSLTWQKLLLADGYWFLQCIAVYYLLFYGIWVIGRKAMGGDIRLVTFIISILCAIAYPFFMPKVEGSIFHSSFHFVCHFSIMIMGSLVYEYRATIKQKSLTADFLWTLVWFVAYFVFLYIGKGKTDYRYWLQILGIIPLHLFVYYIYKVASYSWCTLLFGIWGLKNILKFISALTLEIYIVQFHIITDRFNFLFPLNVVIVFVLICGVAYILKVFTSFFLQFLSPHPFEWKKMLMISNN